jgi:hypothetical protein
VARRAGNQQASGATTGRAAAAVAQVAPSVALTPYNKLASNRPAIADPEPIWTPKRAVLKRGGVDENRCPNAEKGRLVPHLRWNLPGTRRAYSAYSRWRTNGPTVTFPMQPWFSPAPGHRAGMPLRSRHARSAFAPGIAFGCAKAAASG